MLLTTGQPTLSKAGPAATTQPSAPRLKQFTIGILLTSVAGFVDAFAFIEMSGLFASFMSGASVLAGVSASTGGWQLMRLAATMIACFLLGTMTGTLLTSFTRAPALSSVLLLEAVLLLAAAAMAVAGVTMMGAVLPIIAAMGLQNTALQPVDGVRLGTTFVTGTLVSLGQGTAKALIGRGNAAGWWPHAALWGALVAGAAFGAVMHGVLGAVALVVPGGLVGTLALASAVDGLKRTSQGVRASRVGRLRMPSPQQLDRMGVTAARPFIQPYY